jgi:solute carrier family 25 (mitochondrial carnitine/acylcarnitine transporter), member 20/29
MQHSKYASTKECLNEIIKIEGTLGLYKGVSSILLTSPIRSSFNITLYSYLKYYTNFENNFIKGFVPGCITGVALTILACPVERVKCTMQVHNMLTSSLSCMISIYRSKGIYGLYKGIFITLIRDFIGYGIFFGTYEYIKGSIIKNNFNFTWWGWLACGSISGACCWIVILPIDCIKTRYQLSPAQKSYYLITKELIESKGVRGLWSGFNSCLVRTFISSGVGFFFYELIKKKLIST